MSVESDACYTLIIEANAARAAMYRKLAHYYLHELTQDEIDELAQQDFTQFDGGVPEIAEGYAEMAAHLAKANSGTRQWLAVDYAHTFLAAGNYEAYAATPFESVFTSEEGLLMQDARDEVYKMYCEQHIQPNPSLHIPEDHISFEFEFMATMIERTNAALLEGDLARSLDCARTVSAFHTEHQLNWIDDLADTIIEVAETRFYRGLAKVTRGFVHVDSACIADEVAVIEEMQKAA